MKNFCYRIQQVERFHELLRLDVREHQQMTLNDTAGEKKMEYSIIERIACCMENLLPYSCLLSELTDQSYFTI